MQHPSHECIETVEHTVTRPDGIVVSVPMRVHHCKPDNLRTQQPSARRLKLLARSAAHKGRAARGVVFGGEYNARVTTRYVPEKPKRCACGQLQRHCQTTRARCSCGHLLPCGMTAKKRKG